MADHERSADPLPDCLACVTGVHSRCAVVDANDVGHCCCCVGVCVDHPMRSEQ